MQYAALMVPEEAPMSAVREAFEHMLREDCRHCLQPDASWVTLD